MLHFIILFQLESVTFKGVVSSERMGVVLHRFGEGLLSLAYKSCKEVKLTNLVHCVKLQNLRILVSK